MPLAKQISTTIKQSLIRRLKDSFLDSGLFSRIKEKAQKQVHRK